MGFRSLPVEGVTTSLSDAPKTQCDVSCRPRVFWGQFIHMARRSALQYSLQNIADMLKVSINTLTYGWRVIDPPAICIVCPHDDTLTPISIPHRHIDVLCERRSWCNNVPWLRLEGTWAHSTRRKVIIAETQDPV